MATTNESYAATDSAPSSLDELQSLVASAQFEPALALSLRLQLEPSYTSYLAQRVYLNLTRTRTGDGATPRLGDLERLYPLIVDDEWLAVAACHVLRSSSSTATASTASTPSTRLALYALEKGLQASDVLAYLRPELGELIQEADWPRLEQLVHKDQSVKKATLVRKALLEMGDRKNTFQQIWGDETNEHSSAAQQAEVEAEVDEWGRLDIEHDHDHGHDHDAANKPAKKSTKDTRQVITLPLFLSQPLLDTALFLAASSQLDALKAVAARHAPQLWPHRFTILDAIPEWQEPSFYAELLPSLGKDLVETKWTSKPWREEQDWVEHISLREDDEGEEAGFKREDHTLTAEGLGEYYTKRVEHIASLGLVSTALSLVQHCAASLNISRLEELGEELSLLSRLVYDRPNRPRHASTSRSTLDDPAETFTLTHWRSLEPPSIVEAYLSTSTPANIATSIRRLVLPYLSVLEARLERLGQADATLSSRLLIEYLLGLAASTPPQLALLVAVIEASKPTLSSVTRLIKSDEDLARFALACIYGSRDSSAETLVWFSKIFECLPAFNDASEDASNGTTTPSSDPNTTLYSLVSNSSAVPTPKTLYASLLPFDASRLSASLDLLDLHLAQAEVFARYSCAVPLSWFLTSHGDLKAQRAWATRLARTASTGGGGKRGEEGEFESEDEWVALMEDMVAFTHGREEQGDGLRKAFGLLSEEDVLRIFFGGLIAAGRIPLAKSLLQPSSRSAPLEPKAIEELVIAASREFYDNAPSGNLNKGEMKMAFDCLSAAPQTPLIRQERDFIEATSRLCSYKIQSHPGIAVAPIEIRLSKDRLEFVSRLLGANEDAYRHPEVILDLVAKLGYHQDRLAQVRTMAMIADSSLQAGDFEKTVEVCDKMVAKVEEIRRESAPSVVEEELTSKKRPVGDEAAEYAWRECFQLGKHDLFQDLDRRLVALGQALLLCPGDKIVSVLPVWTALEQRVSERPAQLDSTRKVGSSRPGRAVTEATKMVEAGVGAALSSGVKAKETLSRAAAFFSGQTQVQAPQRALHQQYPSGSTHAHPQAREKTADRRSSIYGLDQVAPNSSNPNTSSHVPPSPRRNPLLSPASKSRGGVGGVHAQGGFRAGLSGMAAAGVGWLIGADEERERMHQQQQGEQGEEEEPW